MCTFAHQRLRTFAWVVPSLCWRVISSGGEPFLSLIVVVRSPYMIPNGSSWATRWPRAWWCGILNVIDSLSSQIVIFLILEAFSSSVADETRTRRTSSPSWGLEPTARPVTFHLFLVTRMYNKATIILANRKQIKIKTQAENSSRSGGPVPKRGLLVVRRSAAWSPLKRWNNLWHAFLRFKKITMQQMSMVRWGVSCTFFCYLVTPDNRLDGQVIVDHLVADGSGAADAAQGGQERRGRHFVPAEGGQRRRGLVARSSGCRIPKEGIPRLQTCQQKLPNKLNQRFSS